MKKEWFQLTQGPVTVKSGTRNLSQNLAEVNYVGKYSKIDLQLQAAGCSNTTQAGITRVTISTGMGRDPNDLWTELITFPTCYGASYLFRYAGIESHQDFIRWNIFGTNWDPAGIFITGCGYF